MSKTIRFDDLKVGDAIPALELPPIERIQLALFAGASGDHNPIHVDEEKARAAGLPGVIVHGMLNMAFLGRLLTNWVPQKNVREFGVRFAGMVLPGEPLRCQGRVTGKSTEGGENRLELEIAVENPRNEKVLVGRASVAVP